MAFLFSVCFAENDPFADLKKIADKIIPDDPWAIVVQLIATFFLVLILAKFLVKPVRKYISERQAYIQGNLDEASSKNKEADAKLENAELQLKEAKKASKEMVETAKVTALNEKDRILNDALNEVDLLKDKARKDIDNERIKMKEQLSDEVIDVALLAAGKVLERNVSDEDNKRIISSFIEDKE